MEQQAKPPPGIPASCVRAQFIPAALLLTQLPAGVPGKVAEDGQGAWVPVTTVRDLGGTPCCWLCFATGLAVADISEVSQE